MREKRGRVFIHIAPCPPSHPSPNSPQKGSLGPFLSANILTRLRLFQCPFQNSIESKHGRDRGSPHALKGPVPPPRMPTWPRGLGGPAPCCAATLPPPLPSVSPIKATPPPSTFQQQGKWRRPKPDTRGRHTRTRWAGGNRERA